VADLKGKNAQELRHCQTNGNEEKQKTTGGGVKHRPEVLEEGKKPALQIPGYEIGENNGKKKEKEAPIFVNLRSQEGWKGCGKEDPNDLDHSTF